MARTLAEWLDYIEGIHPSSWELGLERIGAVADRLALRKPAPTSVIVAGTNGKGSTSVCLEQILLASGLTIGCTLSPHVHRFNERVRINGTELDDKSLCTAFEIVEDACGVTQLTYFEFTALATLYCFQRAAVDVAVLEIGLGGRLDAFNIVDGDIAVITNIGIDHTEWLGETPEQIGAEKAGVLRPDQTVVLGADMPASVLRPATELARPLLQAGGAFKCDRQPSGGWRLDLEGIALTDLPLGNLPMANCALAIVAADAVLAGRSGASGPERATGGPAAGDVAEADTGAGAAEAARPATRRKQKLAVAASAVRTGLERAWLPGRCEEFFNGGRYWLVDVAHNPLGANYLRGELTRRYPNRRIFAVLGTLADKDVEGLLGALDTIVERWILVDAPPPRGLAATALAERCTGWHVVVAGSVSRGLEMALSLTQSGDVILAFGSFATAEAVRLELSNALATPDKA